MNSYWAECSAFFAKSNQALGRMHMTVMTLPNVLRHCTKKIVFVNFMNSCQKMCRQPKHVMNLLSEMATGGSLDGQQRLAVVKGRFAPRNFEQLLRRYICNTVCPGRPKFFFNPSAWRPRILSHLPSQEAVRTSLLSCRWRDVYAGVPVVDLLDSRIKQEQFVVTGAILCKAPGTPILTFCLNTFSPPRDLLDQWVIIAASSRVEEIDVKLRYRDCSKHRLCPFERSTASADFDGREWNRGYVKTQPHLFGCPTLRRLRLTNWTLDLPLGTVMSTSLDTLCLARIMDPKKQLQQLLSNCPDLTDLTLQECPSLREITVTSARLKSFAMICCHHARRVKLTSSCLQLLHYKGDLLPQKPLFELANHAGIVALKIEICEDLHGKEPTEFSPATELIQGCAKLSHLHLSFRPSTAPNSSLFAGVLPRLQDLRQLGLQCCFRDDDVRSVANLLLDNAENLEVLSLFPLIPAKEVYTSYYWSDSDSDTESEDGGGDGFDYSSRVADDFWPTHIRCLDDKLKRINIQNYTGLQLEKMLAKFLLSKAAVLEEFSVTLTAGRSQNKSKIAKKLRSWRLNLHTRVTVNRC